MWRRHDDAVICVYDLVQFDGQVVIDMLRTHPMLIIGGILRKNPFYMPSAEFLCEYRQRREGQTVAPSPRA